MGLARVVRALAAPVTELTLLLPLVLLWALIGFGVWAVSSGNPGRLAGGILVLLLSLPPLFRFLTHVVESCANGKVPEAFDAEHFNWIGSMWSLLPLFLVMALVVANYHAAAAWGTTGTWLVIFAAALLLPAAMAVLAITHSALQALNPVALFSIYQRAGAAFLVAPAYLLLVALLWSGLAASLPLSIRVAAGLYLLFSLATVTGTLIAPFRLVEDVYIPDAVEASDADIAADVESHRVAALAHAYGFISRDNRDGGFRHIFGEIEKDPDPVAAWRWYFEKMLGWEQQQHALFFAQHCIHDMLAHGEHVPALKMIMRCRLIDAQFKPAREDLPAAIQAAENSANIELAAVLKRG